MVPGFNGGIHKAHLRKIIDDLATKYHNVDHELVGSGWAFLLVTNIKSL